MKIGKSLVAAVAVAGLTLTACASGTDVGKGLNTDINVRTTPPSKSPTPKKKPTKKKTPTQKPTQQQTRKADEHKVTAQTGFQYEPLDVFARKGDKVLFVNEAEDSSHSFTLENGEYDSGPVKPGGKASFTVDLESGTYNFMCTVVPYMVGGKLHVA